MKSNEINELKENDTHLGLSSKGSNALDINQELLEKINEAFSLTKDNNLMKELKAKVIIHFSKD